MKRRPLPSIPRRPLAPDDALDARRWRALVATAHVMTDAPAQYSNCAKGAPYLILECIGEKADPARAQMPTAHLITSYVDRVLALKGTTRHAEIQEAKIEPVAASPNRRNPQGSGYRKNLR